MYGLVNCAIQEMVIQQHGEKTWEKIKRNAGIDVDLFVRMESYPDEITYKLVGAASAILEVDAGLLLKEFGKYWTQYTGLNGYGEIMEAAGKDLWEFLHNLDELHSRVGLIYPNLQPPSFSCSEVEEQSLLLHYYSKREGLAPMVIGLLQGLGLIFETPIQIEQISDRESGSDHDIFKITKQ